MKKFFAVLNSKRGETLIEVVVSVAIFAIVVTSMLGLLIAATRINTKAFRVVKEDMDIIAQFDGTSPGNVTIDQTATTPTTKFEITFPSPSGIPDPANISADGYYQKATTGSEKLPLRRFKP